MNNVPQSHHAARDVPASEDRPTTLVLRCGTNDRTAAALSECAARFPGNDVKLVCQAPARGTFPELTDSELVLFERERFDWGTTISLMGRLRALRVDSVVLPVRESELDVALSAYLAPVALAFLAGARSVHLAWPGGRWSAVGLASFLRVRLLEVLRLPWVPVATIACLVRLALLRPRQPLACLAPGASDNFCHIVKARWSERVGLTGCARDAYLGNPFLLHYPPLGILLFRYLGLQTYTWLTGAVQLAALSGLAASSGSLWGWVAPAFVVGSPIYRIYWLKVGRTPELLAWAVGGLGWVCLPYLHGIPSGVLFALSLLIHPTGGGFATLMALGRVGHAGIGLESLAVAWGCAGILAAPWLVVFIRVGRPKCSFQTLRQTVPELGIAVDVLLPVVVVGSLSLLVRFLAGEADPASSGIMVGVVGLGLFMIIRRVFLFHAASILTALVFAQVLAFVAHPSLLNALVLLSGIYFWGGGLVGRTRFDLAPSDLTDALDPLERLGRAVPREGRVALEFEGYWAGKYDWPWLVSLAWSRLDVELLSGVAFDQVEFELAYDYDRQVRMEGLEGLQQRLDRVGVTHVVALTDRFAQALVERGGRLVEDIEIPPVPGFAARRCRLIELPWRTSRSHPETRLEIAPNMIRMSVSAGTTYLLKYAWSGGWTAIDDAGRPVVLEDAAPGMLLTPARDGTVTLRYRFVSCYRPGLLLRGAAAWGTKTPPTGSSAAA